MNKIEIFIARLLSIVFHPLLMPTIAVGVLFGLGTHISFALSQQAQLLIILIVLVNTAVAPVLVILFFKKVGYVENLYLNERSDRIYPTAITIFLYLFTWYLFRQANLPEILSFFVTGSILLTVVALAVTFYWKISIHMLSMGGFTGFLICLAMLLEQDIVLLILVSIIIAGLLGTARIKLNAHTPSQVYAGYTVGVLTMLIMYWIHY